MLARLRLRWRGLEFVQRDAHDVGDRDLQRIDTCWSVVTGLSMVNRYSRQTANRPPLAGTRRRRTVPMAARSPFKSLSRRRVMG
jgi:hypothetical protein